MIPYITNRGGPLVGYESLALQGLPVDRLLLTRETQDQLADLAGNAMSTTVVGSCIIRALTLGIDLIEKQSIKLKEVLGNETMEVENAGETTRPAYVEDLDSRISGRSALVVHPLDFSPQGNISLQHLLAEAKATRRLCACEGRDSVTDRTIHECADCGSTSCVKCGLRPEHSYVEMKLDGSRPHPRDFGDRAKNALPMVLRFDPQTAESLEGHRAQAKGTVDDGDWQSWRDAVITATESELHFVELKRQDVWMAVWESPAAQLEFHLHPKLPEWRLFAVPDPLLPANSPIRTLLSRPVARLFCKDQILGGRWQYAIPANSTVNLVIAGIQPESDDDDGLVDSWEKSLGLMTKGLKDKRVWKQLSITLEEPTRVDRFDRDVQGTYLYLPKCGTASASLHKQIKDISGNVPDPEKPELFFFLDPTRCREPSRDLFVFSTSKHRLEFKEYRPVLASLDPSWRQSDAVNKKVKCHIFFEWVTAPELICKVCISANSICPFADSSSSILLPRTLPMRCLLVCSTLRPTTRRAPKPQRCLHVEYRSVWIQILCGQEISGLKSMSSVNAKSFVWPPGSFNVSAQYPISRIGFLLTYRMMELIMAARDVPQLLLKFGGSKSRRATRSKSRRSRIPSKPPYTSAPLRLDPVPSRST